MRLRKKSAFIGAGILTLGLAGAAFGYWSSIGEGAGSAATTTSTKLVITQDNAPSGLTPGGPVRDIDFSIENPGTGVERVASVTVAVANADGTAWSSGACDADDFSITQPTISNDDIDGGDTHEYPAGAKIQMVNAASNQDDCQGVTVPLHFTSN